MSQDRVDEGEGSCVCGAYVFLQSSEALCWRLLKIQKLIKAAESEKRFVSLMKTPYCIASTCPHYRRYLMRRLEEYESFELQDDGSASPANQPSPQEQKPAPVLFSPPPPPPPPPPVVKPKSGRKSDQTSRKKADTDPAAPRKPQNAFLRFFQEHKAEYANQAEGEGLARHHEVTKALARVWGETKPEDKKVRRGLINCCRM